MKLTRFTVLLLLLLVAFPAMAFEYFKTFDGKVKTVDEYVGQGKWTIVMLWASDCHVCNQEAHQYQAFHQKHKNRDAHMLGVSLDGFDKQKEAEAFVQRHKVTFPNLIGKPQNVMRYYQTVTGMKWFGTPTFLIYSPSGELKAQQVGAVPTHLIEAFMEQES